MSENSEDLGISLDSSIKKLLKSKYPNQNFRTPIIKAIAICAQKYLEVIIQESADVCLKKQKNTMTNDHVYEALENKHFSSILNDAKAAGQEIEESIKQRNDIKNIQKTPKLTDEERIQAAIDLKEQVRIQLLKKKQAEAAEAAAAASTQQISDT